MAVDIELHQFQHWPLWDVVLELSHPAALVITDVELKVSQTGKKTNGHMISQTPHRYHIVLLAAATSE